MEKHIFEAVENHVFGTHTLGLAAIEAGVKDFVMISSDKAANPTNMRGTTKRVAELVVRSLQKETTRFVSVRFGNVLGSNGSVVPIFKKQIAAGDRIHADGRFVELGRTLELTEEHQAASTAMNGVN